LLTLGLSICLFLKLSSYGQSLILLCILRAIAATNGCIKQSAFPYTPKICSLPSKQIYFSSISWVILDFKINLHLPYAFNYITLFVGLKMSNGLFLSLTRSKSFLL
jgi:hypothetical protein